MATDYDAPRNTEYGLDADSIEELKSRRAEAAMRRIDLDEGESGPAELPGADLSGEELTVQILPRQADEFTCTRCFLVQHRSQLARRTRHDAICQDCA